MPIKDKIHQNNRAHEKPKRGQHGEKPMPRMIDADKFMNCLKTAYKVYGLASNDESNSDIVRITSASNQQLVDMLMAAIQTSAVGDKDEA